jgi:hypothetical protein
MVGFNLVLSGCCCNEHPTPRGTRQADRHAMVVMVMVYLVWVLIQ